MAALGSAGFEREQDFAVILHLVSVECKAHCRDGVPIYGRGNG